MNQDGPSREWCRNINDRKALGPILTQVYLFVSCVNFRCAQSVFSEPPAPQRIRPVYIISNLRDDLLGRHIEWPNQAETVRLFKEAGIPLPKPDPEVINRVAALMLSPHRVDPASYKQAQWRLLSPPAASRPHLRKYEVISTPLYLYKIRGRWGFTTAEEENRQFEKRIGSHVRSYAWNPVYDPIPIIKEFCATALNVRSHSVDHYLQQWIKGQFYWAFTKSSRLLLQRICERLNTLLFYAPIPRRDEVHGRRLPSYAAATILDEIACVIDSQPKSEAGQSFSEKRQALGIFMLLRFTNSIRVSACTYVVNDAESKELLDSGAELDILGIPKAPKLLLSGTRPLEFTHLLTRLNGALKGVKGLDFVFRGGVLPKTKGGHSMLLTGRAGIGKSAFALQAMADMVLRGRFAAYFTFEENPSSVLQRLSTFRLFDPELYEIVTLDTLQENIQRVHDEKKGLLLIVASRLKEMPDVKSLIEKLSSILEPFRSYRWRGVVLDSLNALEFSVPGGKIPLQEIELRPRIRNIIQAIEVHNFWGILISEEGTVKFGDVPYLVDSEIEVGRAADGGNRWIKVHKSRMQAAHPGPHTVKIRDGTGLSIYPSLASVQSATRRRVRSTLSAKRVIPIPDCWARLGVREIPQKSSTLVWGEPGVGKSKFLLDIALSPSSDADGHDVIPRCVLVITIRTSERRLKRQMFSSYNLDKEWNSIPKPMIRWISPGDAFDANQFIDIIREQLKEGRRTGLEVDRIVFDELESIEYFLPKVNSASTLWPTLIHLLSTEPVTSAFSVSSENPNTPLLQILRASCDCSLRLTKEEAHYEKWPVSQSRPAPARDLPAR